MSSLELTLPPAPLRNYEIRRSCSSYLLKLRTVQKRALSRCSGGCLAMHVVRLQAEHTVLVFIVLF